MTTGPKLLAAALLPSIVVGSAMVNQHERIVAIERRLALPAQVDRADVSNEGALFDQVEGRPKLAVGSAPTKGDPAAPIALVVFSDFWCPYCASFAQSTLPNLESEFVAENKLLIVFKQLPLTALHPRAADTAEMSLCAQEQGRFWKFHDALFAEPSRRLKSTPHQVAALIGLDGRELAQCLNRHDKRRDVAREVQEAEALGISSTPMFLAGPLEFGIVRPSHRLAGAQSLEVFRRFLDKVRTATANR